MSHRALEDFKMYLGEWSKMGWFETVSDWRGRRLYALRRIGI